MGGLAALDGVYRGPRAAALSGVPIATLRHLACAGIVVPCASGSRPSLWSYEDLLAVRAFAWLRRPKHVGGVSLPPAPLRVVRGALAAVRDLGREVWTGDDGSRVLVDAAGHVFARGREGALDDCRQLGAETIDVLAPFEFEGRRGPDLVRPRPLLRIVPGKLAGAPHVGGTRVETAALAALADRGFAATRIAVLYRELAVEAIAEAIDLQRQLGTISDRQPRLACLEIAAGGEAAFRR